MLALDPPPAHVSAYGLTVEPGTPLAARPVPPPGPRRPGRQVPAGRRPARRRRARVVRDLQLGPARRGVPPQPAVLGPGRVPRHRMRRPLAPRSRAGGAPGAGGTSAPRSATSGWSRPGSSAEAAGEDLDAATRRFEASRAVAAHPGTGCPSRRCRGGGTTRRSRPGRRGAVRPAGPDPAGSAARQRGVIAVDRLVGGTGSGVRVCAPAWSG